MCDMHVAYLELSIIVSDHNEILVRESTGLQ
jgi:hypothetical protein